MCSLQNWNQSRQNHLSSWSLVNWAMQFQSIRCLFQSSISRTFASWQSWTCALLSNIYSWTASTFQCAMRNKMRELRWTSQENQECKSKRKNMHLRFAISNCNDEKICQITVWIGSTSSHRFMWTQHWELRFASAIRTYSQSSIDFGSFYCSNTSQHCPFAQWT